MAFYFNCPACGHRHKLSNEWRGKQRQCVACKDVFTLSAKRAAGETPRTHATLLAIRWAEISFLPRKANKTDETTASNARIDNAGVTTLWSAAPATIPIGMDERNGKDAPEKRRN